MNSSEKTVSPRVDTRFISESDMRTSLFKENPSIMSGGFVMEKSRRASEPEPEDDEIPEENSSRSSVRHYEYEDI